MHFTFFPISNRVAATQVSPLSRGAPVTVVLSFLNIYRPRVATRNCVNFSNKPDDCVNHPRNELPIRFVATLIRSSLKILLKVYLTCLRLISETLVGWLGGPVIEFSSSESFIPGLLLFRCCNKFERDWISLRLTFLKSRMIYIATRI